MPTYLDALAALRDGGRLRGSTHRDERTFRRKLDADGAQLSIEIPGTRTLANVLVLPWLAAHGRETFRGRTGPALLTRPIGTDEPPTATNVLPLAEDLRSLVAALPERPDAGRPYGDLRCFVTDGDPGTVDHYLREALRHTRLLAPVWSPPRREASREQRPSVAKTAAERKAASRRRQEDAEQATARAWLRGYLSGWDGDEPAPEPGSRVPAASLYAEATEALEEWADLEEPLDEDDDESPLARVPRRRVFYLVADDVIGTRTRSGSSADAYTIPAPSEPEEAAPMDTATAMLFDRTAEILADRQEERLARLRSGDYVGALEQQREDLAATGTDGAVVNLDAARARRRDR